MDPSTVIDEAYGKYRETQHELSLLRDDLSRERLRNKAMAEDVQNAVDALNRVLFAYQVKQ